MTQLEFQAETESFENITNKPVWKKLLETNGPFWLLLALLINGLLIFFTIQYTLHTFPMSPDEYAYQISAQLFSDGKLSVPSPMEPPWFFNTLNVVNNGAYYGKYPPGWPALLALGTHFGMPWLVNPIFGLLTLIIIFALARFFYSPVVANVAIILTLSCPFFIFNSACLLSHASGLLFLSLAAYFLLASEEYLAFVGFGVAAGFAFLIRPYTTLLVLAPLVLFVVIPAIRNKNKPVLRGLLIGASPVFMAFLALYLLYNYAQTGNLFLQPFELYDPHDHLGFTNYNWKEFSDRLNQNIFDRVGEWIKWTSGIPFVFLFLKFAKTNKTNSGTNSHIGILLAAPAICLLVGYFFYAGSGIFQYGPRYLYEAYALMLIPAALVILATKRGAPLILGLVLTLNSFGMLQKSFYYNHEVAQRVRFFKEVHQLSNAIVFIHAADYDSSTYFTRNGLDFNASVLLVLDGGERNNQLILDRYPGRSFYIYKSNSSNWEKLVEPYQKKTVNNNPDKTS